jgi:hypothetical protein
LGQRHASRSIIRCKAKLIVGSSKFIGPRHVGHIASPEEDELAAAAPDPAAPAAAAVDAT